MTRGVGPFSRCAVLLQHIGTTGNSFKGCSVCNTSVINFRSVCWHCPQAESCHTGWKPEDTSIYICVCILGRGIKWRCYLNRFSFLPFFFFLIQRLSKYVLMFPAFFMHSVNLHSKNGSLWKNIYSSTCLSLEWSVWNIFYLCSPPLYEF